MEVAPAPGSESGRRTLRESVRARSARRLAAVGLVLLILPTLATLVIAGRLPDFDVYAYEWVLLGALAMVRLAWTFLFRRRLVPLLDLPLLGLAFVFTGVSAGAADRRAIAESPLDPALFLIYALLAFLLESPPRRRDRQLFISAFVFGFLAMYGIVLVHADLERQNDLAGRREQLGEQAEEVRRPLDESRFARSAGDVFFAMLEAQIERSRAESPKLATVEYFRPDAAADPDGGGGSIRESYELYVRALERRVELLDEAAAAASGEASSEAAARALLRLNAGFAETFDQQYQVTSRVAAAADRLTELDSAGAPAVRRADRWYETILFSQPFRTLEAVAENQEELRRGIEGFFGAVQDLEERRAAYRADLMNMISQRLAIAILALATLSLVAALRYRFEEEVQHREAARSEQEVRARERERDNWIALTAGLTHTIGNDILAYDAYGGEALDELERLGERAPEKVVRNLKFIHSSNKARLGFIKFLDEFARARKDAGGAARISPTGLSEVAVLPLLVAVRRQVGEIESADLPRDSKDPQVQRQLKKILELPLTVRVVEGDGVVRAGKPGILRFFFYELIKNALRNCSGEHAIEVEVRQAGGRMRIAFINDLEVKQGTGAGGRPLYRLPRIATMELMDDERLERQVAAILAQCFEPGQGGGTGLGLFLIRYFVREYYSGTVSAAIHDWSRRLVRFELEIPDDLLRPGGDVS